MENKTKIYDNNKGNFRIDNLRIIFSVLVDLFNIDLLQYNSSHGLCVSGGRR